jgi:hypothetical protein
MLNSLRVFILLASLSLFAYPQGQSPCCTISGVIVEHATNRPLRGVLVLISPSDKPTIQAKQLTGDDGSFTFSHLPADKYALTAQRRGEQPVGYQHYESFFTGIVVGPANNTANIVFPLESSARISGSVMDDNGDPVRQANVYLFRKSVSFGKAGITQGETRATGASGSFHFGHLEPGTYFIGVQARPWYAENQPQFQPQQPGAPVNQASNPELDVAYPVTYYGDTTDAGAAAPIVLNEGGSATVQVSLRAVPALHIPITGFESAQLNQGFNAVVSIEGPGGVLFNTGAPLYNFNDSAELAGIAPGHYVLEVNRFIDGKQQSEFHQSVDLAAGSTLQAREGSSVSISGRVVAESGTFPNPIFIQFNGDRQGGNGAQVGSDGSFSLNQPLRPGRYEVLVGNAGPGAYTKSVTAKGAATSGNLIEIPETGSVEVLVTVATGLSKLDGFAVRNGAGVPAAMVLLLPNDPNHASRIRRDQSDSDGSFALPNVVPGRYTLLAIDNGSDLAYQDPAVMKPYVAHGLTLDIPLSNNSAIQVPVLTRR